LTDLLAYVNTIAKFVAPTHHLYLDAVNNVIVARIELRDYGQALVDAEANYQAREKCYGADNVFTLQSLSLLSKLYVLTLQWERALTTAESIVASQERLITAMPREHVETVVKRKQIVIAKWNVAATAFRLRRFDRARSVARETIRAVGEFDAGDPERYELANSAWYLLNRVAQQDGSKNQAETLAGLKASYEGLRALLGPDHPRTFPLLANLGFATADIDAALAVPILGDYVALVERERLRLRLPADRQVFFEKSAGAYKRFSFAAAEAGRVLDAFYGMEWSKARSLRDAFSLRLALADDLVPRSDATALKTAETLVSDLEAQLEAGIPDQAKRQALAGQLQAAKIRFANMFDDVSGRSMRFQVATQPRIQNPTNVAKVLRADEVFISYLTRRVDGPQLEVLVAILEPSGKLSLINLGNATGLEYTVDAYVQGLSHAEGLAGISKNGNEVWYFRDAFFVAPGGASFPGAEIVTSVEKVRSALSNQLLPDPIRSVLSNYRRWVISPEGSLWSIPFETLNDGDALVVDRHIVRYVHSWTMLTLLTNVAQAGRSRDARLLVFGGAKYSDTPPESPSATGQLEQFEDLPFSSREVETLAKRFMLVEGTSLFRGPSATRKNLFDLNASGRLGRSRMVLLSAHGYLDDKNPALSALVLGRPEGGSESDRYIRARELALFDMPTELVVVSSCESGSGRVASGEGILGLPYALFAAGALDSVVTRWKVYDDPVTATLVSEFLTAVDSGKAPDEALTEIKRKLKQANSEAHWAAFVLVGR